jgi:hypothetical protein
MQAHIVGGGFGGLAAAAYLIRNAGVPGPDITIYEAEARPGGGFFLGGNAKSGYNLPGWRDTLLDTKAPDGPYAARPLYGIWAASPFLHNGSVPTLYDLLLPPERRPKTFALGARQYDPVKLGFAVETSCSQQDCLVDTTRTGDGNSGHLWGTDLSEPDRMALLEYLKTY